MSGPDKKQLLKLQRMEMALANAWLHQPQELSRKEFDNLRYVLGCARLYRFAPGAALGKPHGEELVVDHSVIAPLREQVFRLLGEPLRREKEHCRRLQACHAAMPTLLDATKAARDQLLKHKRFSTAELDAEVGQKALTIILGGGGGAGFVYIGAVARLRKAGLLPDYLVGASMGSLLGAMMAQLRNEEPETLLAWAKTLNMRKIFARPHARARYTLPGVMRLHLQAMHDYLEHEDGTPLRLGELEVPYEAVVAGVRRRFYEMIPESFLNVLGPGQGRRLSKRVASRMLQLTALVNPMLMTPVVLGRDADTRDIRVADAVGLSCAIPGILQYEPRHVEERSDALLNVLREQQSLALYADGGVVENVPARVAWEGVHSGRIGTRNAFFLAMDCFAPHWDSRHVWLGPLQQLVQAQLPAQRPYFDWLLRFDRTLSPIQLLPGPQDFDRAWRWGWEQTEALMPLLELVLAPARWSGSR